MNETKICRLCKIEKPTSAFGKWNYTLKSDTQKKATYVKSKCSNCASKLYRKRHPETVHRIAKTAKEKYRRFNWKRKQMLCDAIAQHECQKCKFNDIRAFVFHHKDPGIKSFEISYGLTHSYSLEKLVEEAKKCEILCQNCHTIEHSNLCF